MATRTFDLSTHVDIEPAAAIDFLVDLTRHRGIHPFVISADIVAEGRDADGSWQDWRVVERPRLGPIRYTIRFPARMRRTSPTSMVGTVQAAPGCSLITTTTATQVDGGTDLRETTTVTAPRPVLGYMTSQARVAHARTYSLLPTELATEM
jgi:environmental stress-induced protein Ves